MPRTYGLEDEIKNSEKSCGNIRDDYKDCVLHSDCVFKDKKLPSQCISQGLDGEECQALRTLMFECKRSLLDMRTRFRGRKGY